MGRKNKMYGLITNRLEEGRTVDEITIGMPITMYHWSDRTCYYVTEVIDQKHIKVKKYRVCADREKTGGMGHQNWLYFKTAKEEYDYLIKYFPDTRLNDEYPEEEWVYRYNTWKTAYNYDQKFVDDYYEDMKDFAKKEDEMAYLEKNFNNWVNNNFTAKEQEKMKAGKTVTHYFPLSGNISFGRRDYYYDWSF